MMLSLFSVSAQTEQYKLILTDLLALLYAMLYCVYVTFLYGVLGRCGAWLYRFLIFAFFLNFKMVFLRFYFQHGSSTLQSVDYLLNIDLICRPIPLGAIQSSVIQSQTQNKAL